MSTPRARAIYYNIYICTSSCPLRLIHERRRRRVRTVRRKNLKAYFMSPGDSMGYVVYSIHTRVTVVVVVVCYLSMRIRRRVQIYIYRTRDDPCGQQFPVRVFFYFTFYFPRFIRRIIFVLFGLVLFPPLSLLHTHTFTHPALFTLIYVRPPPPPHHHHHHV